MYEWIAAFVAICLAFLFFWSPILVSISALILIVLFVIYYNSKYFKHNSNGDNISKKIRPKTSQLITSDNRFGPNVRHIKTARRTLSFRNNGSDNYHLNYLNDPLNAKYFLQSDNLLASTSGLSVGSRPQSSQDMSYSFGYRPTSVSPISQLGNMPFVKLSSTSSEVVSPQFRPKTSAVKPVTVRIAPMPENMSRLTLSRLSNKNSPQVPTLGPNVTLNEMMESEKSSSTQTKSVVDALKKSLRRKRESDFHESSEVEDNSIITANKKAKREATDSYVIPNGIIASKQAVKRPANDGTDVFHKRVRNNEILSSYSSSPQMIQTLKNKRKLSPEVNQTNEMKILKGLPKEKESIPTFNTDIQMSDNNVLTFNFIEDNKSDETKEVAEEDTVPKRSYGLPFHLHSMEDHERDRNKTRHRLSRFLTAVKEATSPKSEEQTPRLTTTIEPIVITETGPLVSNEASLVPKLVDTHHSSDVLLPAEPAPVIFTTSRIETSVTTSLLNTPISSTMTTRKESLSPMNSDITIANPVITSQTVTNNPVINPVITESSSINSLPNYPTVSLFTAKPQSQPSLFNVGAGGSTTRRIAQNSRLRSRQRR